MGGREASCGITMTKEGDLQECAFLWGSRYISVTSHEQLSLAEFSVEKARPKVYENGHKNIPGVWMD